MPTSDELKKAGEAIQEFAGIVETFGGVLIAASDALQPIADALERSKIRNRKIDILKSKRFWLGLTNSEARRLMELEN